MMRIGLYIKWNKNSLQSKGNVLGDELIGESLCRALNELPEVEDASLYAPNFQPRQPLDVMIYLNDTRPRKGDAKKHVLYFQNGYNDEGAHILKQLRSANYDGYIFFSMRLLEIHQADGYEGLFLPFGVDISEFHPMAHDPKYAFDIAYVGNDIKGTERTTSYLYPAAKYNFGLFGNWKVRKPRWRPWRNINEHPPYKRRFEEIARGRIPQEKVPVLYSSSKINLNCTLQACVDWDVITLRTYEILACNGFLISDKVPAAMNSLKEYVVFTDGGDDLIDKINFYLNHDKEREAISRRGFDYVKQFASIETRAKELYNYIRDLQ